MSIRKITMDDVNSIGEIYTKAFNHHPDSIKLYKLEPYIQFCMNDGYAFVSENDSKINGFIIGYERPSMFSGRIAYIELLAVRPENQGQGYAKGLMEQFIKTAQDRGIKEVSVSTACYKDAYLIYRHLGFTDSQSDLRYLFKRL